MPGQKLVAYTSRPLVLPALLPAPRLDVDPGGARGAGAGAAMGHPPTDARAAQPSHCLGATKGEDGR